MRVSRVVAVLDQLKDVHNISAILRSCDALGVDEVHIIQRFDEPPVFSVKVAKGCDRWLDVYLHPDASTCLDALKTRGVRLFCADSRATTPVAALGHAEGTLGIVFGNEHEGVSAVVRRACEGRFAVPMRGMSESFNVSVAAALTLQSVVGPRDGDLDPEAVEALYARYLIEAVRASELVVGRYLGDAQTP